MACEFEYGWEEREREGPRGKVHCVSRGRDILESCWFMGPPGPQHDVINRNSQVEEAAGTGTAPAVPRYDRHFRLSTQ